MRLRDRVRGLFPSALLLGGALFALVSLANILFILLADFFAVRERPYFGIFGYFILPGLFLLSLSAFAAALFWERRRRRLEGEQPYPILDLNRPRHRGLLAALAGGTVLFIAFTVVGSYQLYQFTDSVTFCGQACHSVMKPEFTAYQASPHARVRCTECHVGSGAEWFFRSKLTGAGQAYSLFSGDYSRPIPTPVRNLRPARETCEQCHWPEKFWGDRLRVITRYASDERNTPREIRMVLRVGGGSEAGGRGTGIHWHMNLANEVWYIATDPHRQDIPWVQAKDRGGEVREYFVKGVRLTPEEIAKAEKRRMDCIDCHSRPSHIFQPPDKAVNESLLAGRLDASLPFLRREAVKALAGSYPSTPAAREGIAAALDAFYRAEFAALYAQKRKAIEASIAELQRLYDANIFPEMKADWRAHPDNIGHIRFRGCFRCHDGQHVSQQGKAIRNDCTTCHLVLAQSEGGKPIPPRRGEFTHPVELGDLTAVLCSDCHAGGVGP